MCVACSVAVYNTLSLSSSRAITTCVLFSAISYGHLAQNAHIYPCRQCLSLSTWVFEVHMMVIAGFISVRSVPFSLGRKLAEVIAIAMYVQLCCEISSTCRTVNISRPAQSPVDETHVSSKTLVGSESTAHLFMGRSAKSGDSDPRRLAKIR
jgi:hypothetical protein